MGVEKWRQSPARQMQALSQLAQDLINYLPSVKSKPNFRVGETKTNKRMTHKQKKKKEKEGEIRNELRHLRHTITSNPSSAATLLIGLPKSADEAASYVALQLAAAPGLVNEMSD